MFFFGSIALVIAVAYVLSEHPDARETIFASGKSVTGTVVAALLFLPNLFWVTIAGCLGIPVVIDPGDYWAAGTGRTMMGYGQNTPLWAWLGLVVPIAIFCQAGYVAARAAGSDGRRAVAAGLLSEVPLVIVAWAASIMTGIALRSVNDPTAVGLAGGPAFILPLVWAIVGGWIGALTFLSRQRGPTTTHTLKVPPAPAPSP